MLVNGSLAARRAAAALGVACVEWSRSSSPAKRDADHRYARGSAIRAVQRGRRI